MRTRSTMLVALVALLVGVLPVGTAGAATDCTFTVNGTTMTLDGDCTTDGTITIPDGFTLNGAGHTITAVDPAGGHFTGAVVASAGGTAHVVNVTVTAAGLANVCDGGAARLRGIMFEGASGSITHSSVVGINQGASGCQEGNAIEVRNAPFYLGTPPELHPNTQHVEISHNTVLDYQKTGIVANGDVDVTITYNSIGESATQDDLAANSIQLGFGATGYVGFNRVEGNQWKGTSNFAATAFLAYLANGVTLDRNHVEGNSDIGIFFFGNDGLVTKNKVFDEGDDHPNSGYDVGIGNYGSGNEIVKNKVGRFDTPFAGPVGEKNKALPVG